jgi:hydrogenase maturation protein HypF
MRELGFPVVATSGNITDEPIASDEQEALQRLARIADMFIVRIQNRKPRRQSAKSG